MKTMPMTLPRTLSVPIVATLSIASWVSTVVLYFLVGTAHNHFFRILGTSWPKFSDVCVTIVPYGFIIPTLTIIAGTVFVVPKESRLSSFVWFVCGSILGVVLWGTLCVVDVLLLLAQLQRV